MKISIIIPTHNEAENIQSLISFLRLHSDKRVVEILVCDGLSTDNTAVLAEHAGAKILLSPEKNRAYKMDFGAMQATGDLLYFIHADTLPPATFLDDITDAVSEGFEIGRYLSRYDSSSYLLKINALLSRLDVFAGMGGDQTLFVTKSLYARAGGFDTSMRIMEEFEFCARARKLAKYKVMYKPVLISARKYESNSWIQVQRANYTIFKMYKNGETQQRMIDTYQQMLNYPKP